MRSEQYDGRGDGARKSKNYKRCRIRRSLSPCLFKLYVREAVNRVRKIIQVGIQIQDEKVDMFRFANGIVVLRKFFNKIF